MSHPMSSDPTQVVQAVEAMTAAFHAADLPAVLSAYAPQAAVAFAPGSAVSGRDALADGFAGFFAVNPQFTYAGHDVLVAGDLALHIAPWSMRGRTPDGVALNEHGLSVAVLRRSAGGRWQIALDNPYGDRLLAPRGR